MTARVWTGAEQTGDAEVHADYTRPTDFAEHGKTARNSRRLLAAAPRAGPPGADRESFVVEMSVADGSLLACSVMMWIRIGGSWSLSSAN